MQRVFNDKLIERIADELVALQRTENTTLPVLRNQLADTNRGIENMLNAIQQGVLTSSTKQRLEESASAYGKSPYGRHLRNVTCGKYIY